MIFGILSVFIGQDGGWVMFLLHVPAHSGGPGQRAVNRFVVVVISVMFLPAILMLQYF